MFWTGSCSSYILLWNSDKGIVCLARSLVKSKRQGGSLLAAIMKNKIRLMGIISTEEHLYDNLPTLWRGADLQKMTQVY